MTFFFWLRSDGQWISDDGVFMRSGCQRWINMRNNLGWWRVYRDRCLYGNGRTQNVHVSEAVTAVADAIILFTF